MRFETEDAAERRCDLIERATLRLNYMIFSLKWGGMTFSTMQSMQIFLLCRYTGIVTGISDMDPVRWPGSKWRCLLV